MITSVKLWNEPNNLSHWDVLLDPGWRIYTGMVVRTAASLRGAGVDVVREVRTGLSWAESHIPGSDAWFAARTAGRCAVPQPAGKQK